MGLTFDEWRAQFDADLNKALTLAFVNGARIVEGNKPLSEFPPNVMVPNERASTCPVAKAVDAFQHVTSSGVVIKRDRLGEGVFPVFTLPDYVRETIRNFDAEIEAV